MIKILKNQNGFTGLMGLIIAIVVIGIMSAMLVPTFTAKMNYEQAKKIAGVANIIRNAENTWLAKNGSFASLDQLGASNYISTNLLNSIDESTTAYGGSYYVSTWNAGFIGNQDITGCLTDVPWGGQGCTYNPGVSNGYFLGLTPIPQNPQNFAGYFETEIPGSGIGYPSAAHGGGQELSYVAPVPNSPPPHLPPPTPNPSIFISNGQFIVPTNPAINTIYVTAIAGGGSGGGAWGNGGTGGNAGQYIIDQPFSVTPGESINITIGQGGAAGWSNNGGNTIIGNLITLSGGSGGCPNCLPEQGGQTGASSPFGTGGAPGIAGGWIYGGNAGGNGAGGGGGAANNGNGGYGSDGMVEISYY